MSYELTRMTNIGTAEEAEFQVEEFCVVDSLEAAIIRSGKTLIMADKDAPLGQQFLLMDPPEVEGAKVEVVWSARKRRERLGGDPASDPDPTIGNVVENFLRSMVPNSERR